MTYFTFYPMGPTSLFQKLSVVQTWRPLAFFLSCNADISTSLLKKIREINGNIAANEVLHTTLFKNNPGLNAGDLKDFGLWLLDQTRANGKDLDARLGVMRKRRLLRWHIYQAPDDVVMPDLSMHLPVFVIGVTFVRIAIRSIFM